MYELTGTINEIYSDFKTGKTLLYLSINEKQDAINCYDELHTAEKLSFKIGKHRKKRSLDANSYFWV